MQSPQAGSRPFDDPMVKDESAMLGQFKREHHTSLSFN